MITCSRLVTLCLSLVVWLLDASLAAQTASLAFRGEGGREILAMRATLSGGSSLGSGLGFACVDLVNADARAHDVTVEVFSPRSRNADIASRRSLVVEPGSMRFFLPVAMPPMRCRIDVTVDGATQTSSVNFRVGDGIVGLFVSDLPNTAAFGQQVLEAMPAVPSRADPKPVPMQTRDLPTDWRLLTSFSTIIVDGRSPLSGELQEAVRRYAFAGGTVVVSSPTSLPVGPLRDQAGSAGDVAGKHGFGHILAIDGLGGDTSQMRRQVAKLPDIGTAQWPAASGLFVTQDIAGLGQAPVTVFVLVILVFAILVGPVNFWVLRRKKKPLLALLTVPLAGFGTTIAILAYGIFHDGFGVRGVMRSWTILDQASHEAVSVSAHTLFAGLAPNDLTMGADSMLLSNRASKSRRNYADRWHWNATSERLDGGVLPSRTVTPLVSVHQGAARQRLTLRKSGDTLEVLADGAIAPTGVLVLRDLQGQYWAGKDAVLHRVSAGKGREGFRMLLAAASVAQVQERGEIRQQLLPTILSEWGNAGTYATTVSLAPWLDDHGLSVDYDAQTHYLFGRLHSEDFVR